MIPQYAPEFGEEERDAVNTYMASGGWLTEHTETELFEEEFAKAVGARWASAVNNGTISLSIALLAMGLEPGDRVVVPDMTMIATASAVQLIGCKPVLCDIDPDNLCLDLDKALSLQMDTGAKAVIYVSFNGRSHDADRLISFRGALRCQDAYLLEDAAQALGSQTPDGVPIGTLGEISSFSLSPHKIVSTGQGGMLLTSNPHMRKRIEEIKDFGRESGGADIHPTFGINAKFTDLQAVIGRAQLKKLRWRMQRKREMYETYRECVDGLGVIPSHSSVPWFIDFYTGLEGTERLAAYLKERGIGTRPMYPPLHRQGALRNLEVIPNDFPVATRYSESTLWLPSSFSIYKEEISFISRTIKEGLSWIQQLAA